MPNRTTSSPRSTRSSRAPFARRFRSILRAAGALALALALAPRLRAADKPASPDSLAPRWKLAAFPVLAYATDTRGIGGGWLQALRAAEDGVPESQLATWATLSQNRQAELGLRPELWLAGDRWLLEGELSYSKWPDVFYGVGPRSREADELAFTAERVKLEALVGRRVDRPTGGRLLTGLLLDWRRESFQELEAGFPLPGHDGEDRGLGLDLRFDGRDDTVWPRSGRWARLLASSHGGLFGGDWRYSRWLLDLRGYRPLAGGVLAGQFALEDRGGSPGFRQLARMGEFLRAYSGARYLDRALAAARVEWRRALFGRAGFVLFAGAGAVGPALDRLAGSPLRPSVGAGGRWEMIQGTGLNLRLDGAFGDGSSAVYIRLGEEF